MSFDFLQLAGQPILVTGVANRKSVAYHIGQLLTAAGAEVLYSVRSPARQATVAKLVAPAPVYVCDVEHEEQITALREEIGRRTPRLYGLVHSIAFAEYAEGMKPFHETGKQEFLRAMDISCYSLVALSRAFQDLLDPDGAVVAVSISTTRMASENYGYMAPCKAALDSTLVFLAKAFSQFSRVRFNAVAPGLLKTSASAGIPGYVDSYLYAEQATLRKQAVKTEEAAAVAAFLLSPRSSGVNAQNIVVDAGMSVNYFDRNLVQQAMRPA
jgi:enoyl-[acyl-carrier protein] reductase I